MILFHLSPRNITGKILSGPFKTREIYVRKHNRRKRPSAGMLVPCNPANRRCPKSHLLDHAFHLLSIKKWTCYVSRNKRMKKKQNVSFRARNSHKSGRPNSALKKSTPTSHANLLGKTGCCCCCCCFCSHINSHNQSPCVVAGQAPVTLATPPPHHMFIILFFIFLHQPFQSPRPNLSPY